MIRPIKLTDADIARFWSKVNKCGSDKCWEWQACRNNHGYGLFRIGGRVRVPYLAHRVAFVITTGDTELQVCHHCNNPSCCNPKHLYAGTQKDNMQQCVIDGRAADNRGEKHGCAKLTKSEVHEIRALYIKGRLLCEIADEYGIHRVHVSRICNSKQWKHI